MTKTYDIKMLNGLVIKDLSPMQIKDGLLSGKYLPSDFISAEDGGWQYIKESEFYKVKQSSGTWKMLFALSFIVNIMMLMLIMWQKSRIEQLLN